MRKTKSTRLAESVRDSNSDTDGYDTRLEFVRWILRDPTVYLRVLVIAIMILGAAVAIAAIVAPHLGAGWATAAGAGGGGVAVAARGAIKRRQRRLARRAK